MTFDGTIACAVIAAAAVAACGLNLFWLIAGLRYRGSRRRTIRTLWVTYLLVPFLVASTFAVSISLHPLRNCPEPFSSDWRHIGYFIVWIVLASLIAQIGVLLLAVQTLGGDRSGGTCDMAAEKV